MHSYQNTTSLTIRGLDPAIKQRLCIRAAEHGNSMEEEARRILSAACEKPMQPTNAFDILRHRFADIGGVELELPEREPGREPPTFD